MSSEPPYFDTDERWAQSYPQTDLPTGDQPQAYNPYRRRDEQIRLATRFTQNYTAVCSVVVHQLEIGDATIGCARFDPMMRTVCQNYTYYLIEVVGTDEKEPTTIPSCHEHVGYLIPHAVMIRNQFKETHDSKD